MGSSKRTRRDWGQARSLQVQPREEALDRMTREESEESESEL